MQMRSRKLEREIEQLYQERYRKFLRVALAVLRDEHAARDAVQDGFANALRGLSTFVEGDLEGWVWRIVLRAALSAKQRRTPDPEFVEPGGTTEEALVDETGIRGWIAALPERQRLAVFLRYYADLDYRTIAATLEIEVGTVSATLSQAHTALRRQLREVQG
jgi:RNA polymerase sigma factor (sigma-70 family)